MLCLFLHILYSIFSYIVWFFFWYTQKFTFSVLVHVSSLNGISPLFYVFNILLTWLLIIDDFHYCLCKQSVSLFYCLPSLIFYNFYLNYFYVVSILIFMHHAFIVAPTFILVMDLYLNILNDCHQALASNLNSYSSSHYLLPSTLSCSSITCVTLSCHNLISS